MPSGGKRQGAGRPELLAESVRKDIALLYQLYRGLIIYGRQTVWAFSICNDLDESKLISQALSNRSHLDVTRRGSFEFLKTFCNPFERSNFLSPEYIYIDYATEFVPIGHAINKQRIKLALSREKFPKQINFRSKALNLTRRNIQQRTGLKISKSQLEKSVRQFPLKDLPAIEFDVNLISDKTLVASMIYM